MARRLLFTLPEAAGGSQGAHWRMGTVSPPVAEEHRKTDYTRLLTSGKLNSYLNDIDQQAKKLFSQLVSQMTAAEGVTEALKAADQMEWMRRMNNVQNRAREIVNSQLIYN